MNKAQTFRICVFTILLFGFILRIVPLLTNSFYFTMDQGRDAVYVREMLTRGRLFLQGPETSTPGVYHGPLWYYFLAIGYFLLGGHPAGGPLMLIFLNLSASLFLMVKLKKHISTTAALVVGGALQIFWPFYESSSYAFNPFPLISLALITIFLLSEAAEGNKGSYVLAAITTALGFHAHIVSALPLAILSGLTGLFLLIKHRIDGKTLLSAVGISFLLFLPQIISEFLTGFSQLKAIQAELFNTAGVFSNTGGISQVRIFLTLLGSAAIPQRTLIGVIAFILVTGMYVFSARKKKLAFPLYVVTATLVLYVLAFLWFSTNATWKPWQTLYLSPLLFIALLLMMLQLPKKIFVILIIVVQAGYFYMRYTSFPKDDASRLANELGAIHWVYTQADGKGFSVYTYLPSVLDYPYQYLIWWFGKKQFGYLPCEYASFPGSPKLFIPGRKTYESPKKDCTNIRFLIVEPDTHTDIQKEWLETVRKDTTFEDQAKVGTIIVEKGKIQ